MRLSEKVKKLQSGKALESAVRHLRRTAAPRRFGLPLTAERLIKSIPAAGLAEIRRKHAVEDPGEAWPKYLNLTLWMDKNLQRVRDLGLDAGGRRRVLDLGCGAGYFLYICRQLGHDTLGLDIDEVPMFAEMMSLLGLRRVVARVQPFVALPRFAEKFDLITAFMICFNGHKSPALWGPKEWAFFLDDAATRLNPGGRIRLGFNRERDDSFYTEELRQFFLDRGGTVDEHRITLRPDGRRR